jgi:predicted Zn-dependent peptidase
MQQAPSSFSPIEYAGGNIISYYMKGINLHDYHDVINSIEYEDVVKKLKSHFAEKNAAVSVIYPA